MGGLREKCVVELSLGFDIIYIIINWILFNDIFKLIAVTKRSGAGNIFVRSKTGIVGSNPIRGKDVCLRFFCVCIVLCVRSGLATGWSPIQGVLPTILKIQSFQINSEVGRRQRGRRRILRSHQRYLSFDFAYRIKHFAVSDRFGNV
jgi:hypothetical protein